MATTIWCEQQFLDEAQAPPLLFESHKDAPNYWQKSSRDVPESLGVLHSE